MALLSVGASPSVFTDFALHSHDCYEIIVNTEGQGIAVMGEKEVPFSPGTIHIVPPGTLHKKSAAGGFRDMYLHTDSLRRVASSGKENAPLREPILLLDDACRSMEKIVSVLLERWLMNPKSDAVMDSLYDAVLQLIEEGVRQTPPDPVINHLIHIITVSYSNPEFHVTEALEATGYSKDHIRRRFQQATGMTPNEYLKDVRIRYAKRLLREKGKLHFPINEIALMCGYYDPAYFCRLFRKEVGKTPSEFTRISSA